MYIYIYNMDTMVIIRFDRDKKESVPGYMRWIWGMAWFPTEDGLQSWICMVFVSHDLLIDHGH